MVQTKIVSDEMQNIDIRIPIRREFLKEQPFETTINSRLGVAVFMSFFGDSCEVG